MVHALAQPEQLRYPRLGLGPYWPHWSLLVPTGPYWSLLVPTGLPTRSLTDCSEFPGVPLHQGESRHGQRGGREAAQVRALPGGGVVTLNLFHAFG